MVNEINGKYYTPTQVLEIKPDANPERIQIRVSTGWVREAVFMIRVMFEHGENFIEDCLVEESGAGLRLKFMFTPQQLQQLKEYV